MSKPALPPIYRDRAVYTVEDAALLWAHVLAGVPLDPNKSRGVEYSIPMKLARQELIANLATVEIQTTPVVFGVPPEKHFRGPDLAEYAKRRGYPGLFGFEDEDPGHEDQGDWGFTHDTMLLRVVRDVVREYWEGKDPKHALPKDTLVQQIMARFGLTEREARAVDLVARHDSRRKKFTN